MVRQVPVGRAGEGNARPAIAGQYDLSPATTASPSSPVITVAPALPSVSSYDQLEEILYGSDSHYGDHDYHHTSLPEADLALEHTAVDFLDSSANNSHVLQHSLSADYLALARMGAHLSMNIDNIVPNETHEGAFESIEQSLVATNQSTPLSPPPSDSSQLEQGLKGLLDDSRLSSIVDGMINSPLQGRCLTCVTELRGQCFHAAAAVYDGSDENAQLCRCPTMLNKLYLIVMDPKLSHSNTKLLPLDLTLFLEQALQNTVEAIKHCTVCSSSALAANGITLCIAADWIANNIQATIESEINIFTGRKQTQDSLWRGCCPEQRSMEMGAAREQGQHHSNCTTNHTTVPPSLDARNSLRIGIWSASGESWALCVSAILARRINRMRKMLSAVDGDDMIEDAEMVTNTTTVKAKREMAKDIRTRADLLLGMVKTWVHECDLRY